MLTWRVTYHIVISVAQRPAWGDCVLARRLLLSQYGSITHTEHRHMKAYQFSFFFDGQRGTVTVYPAVAFVNWGGMQFESDAAKGGLALAIFKARLLLA